MLLMGVEGINRKNPMKPLPVRVTPQQYERLSDTRRRTGLAIQEHVRRALDLYLDKVEREARANPAPIVTSPSAPVLEAAPSSPDGFAGISTAPVLRSR